jgi:nucleotide-binding universal stress UspA family protein
MACTDLSEASERVLSAAARLAVDDGATLEILHVHSPPWLTPLSGFYEFRGGQNADYRCQYEEVLGAKLETEVEAVVRFFPIEVNKSLRLEADAEHALIDYITGSDADLVVVGGHGASGFVQSLLGTTTERILMHCANSVLVVKSREDLKD